MSLTYHGAHLKGSKSKYAIEFS